MSEKQSMWQMILGVLMAWGAAMGLIKSGERIGVQKTTDALNRQTAADVKKLKQAKKTAKDATDLLDDELDKWL